MAHSKKELSFDGFASECLRFISTEKTTKAIV